MEVIGQLNAPVAFLPAKQLCNHCIWGWVDPRVSLEVMEKIKVSLHKYKIIINACSLLVEKNCNGS
jgi:hypothetical protein